MKSPLCLVTGAPGWLGTRFVQVLRNGLPELPVPGSPRKIRCLVLPGTPASALAQFPPDVETVAGDVRDPRAVREFVRGAEGATLFHLCGVVTPPRTRDFHDVNLEGTRNVLEAAVNAGVGRTIAISSNTVAGPNPYSTHLFDEDAPQNPQLPYGRSKALMEDLVNEASAAGRVETVIIRPCRFHGPGQPRARSRFFRMIREGRLPIAGRGESRWSLSYIDDICQALLLAERTPGAAGRTYWIADRRPYTVREIVDTVRSLLENEFGMRVSRRELRVPTVIARAAAAADALVQRFGMQQLHLHALGHLQVSSACSIARAERELGYDPKVALEEGTRRSIRWCLDTGQEI
jgi:nucleoside-diphosphate-sugar epimerase